MDRKNSRLEESVERLLARDDVIVTHEQVGRYIASGQWSETTFVDCLEQHAVRNPHKVAIIDEDGSKITYAEYDQKTDRIAKAFLDLGLRPDDRIAIQLPNWSAFQLSVLGAAKARILPVICHLPYTEHDLDYVIGLTEAKAIVIPDRFKNRDYLEMVKKVQAKHSCLKHVIVVAEKKYDGTVQFNDLLRNEIDTPAIPLEDVRPVGTDPYVITFTSGTTGKPKAVFQLHTNYLYWIKQCNRIWKYPEDGNWLLATPIYHNGGIGFSVSRSLYIGDTTTMLSSWNASKAVELMEQFKCTHLPAVGPMLMDLTRFEGIERRELASLKNIITFGAPCPAAILNQLQSQLHCEISSIYGYSESGIIHCTRPGDPISITSTSFGKIQDGVEVKMIDDAGNELQAPCEGEIIARSASFIPGYYGQPENSKKMFDEEGWFHSADIIRVDPNGYCTFIARNDDLINRGGVKIDPREIEEALFTHPLISQAAVVAMPDERLGERVAVFIILKDSSKTLTLTDVTQFLTEKNISQRSWPEAIQIVESFPLTSAGKIQKFVLRQWAKELKPQMNEKKEKV